MIKGVIDLKIRDDGIDALRKSLYEAKEAQAEANGYRRGFEEGFEKGRPQGFDEAVEMMLKLLMDFKNGNRSW